MWTHKIYHRWEKIMHYKKKLTNLKYTFWEEITYSIETFKPKLVFSAIAVRNFWGWRTSQCHHHHKWWIHSDKLVCLSPQPAPHFFNTRNSKYKFNRDYKNCSELIPKSIQSYLRSNKRKAKPKGFSFTYSDDSTVASRVWLQKSVPFV